MYQIDATFAVWIIGSVVSAVQSHVSEYFIIDFKVGFILKPSYGPPLDMVL